jgi:hydrogenase maturation protein HypF
MALGISPMEVTYEGQAAIRLEAEAKKASTAEPLEEHNNLFSSYENNNLLLIDWSNLFRQFSPEFCAKLYSSQDYFKQRNIYALMFHKVVARAALEMVKYGLEKIKTKNIVLSGGVFMNRLLTNSLSKLIENETSLKVYIHNKIPPNDGGIALGQIALANKNHAKKT